MPVESAFEIAFAVSVVGAAAALAGAAFELAGRRVLIAARVAIGVAAVGAWVAFALDPSTELAIVGTGLIACVLAVVGSIGLRRGMARRRALGSALERCNVA